MVRIYGGYNKEVHPPQTLCLIQSALLYGTPTMFTALVFVRNLPILTL